MARKGRKHGMVRTTPGSESPLSTADVLAKVTCEPVIHPKFTGKCGVPRCKECYIHPCTKSKDKAKGTHKARSNDVTFDHRLATWRVVGGGHVLNSNGFSATAMLDCLVDLDRYFDVDEADQELDR